MAVQRKMTNLIASIPESNRWKVDKEIDFENTDVRGRIIPQHLGRIASDMTDWEGEIADNLGLTRADRADIIERYPRKPSLQRREALSIWKSGLGSAATYRALMEVFVRAGRMSCAESVAEILREGAVPTQPGTTAATPAVPVLLASGGSGAVTTGGSGHLPESTAGTSAPQSAGQQAQAAGNSSTNAGNGGTPPGFSPSMEPHQLEQWLLREYGRSYENDISKVKGDLINGELFLGLPDDKEWLEELKLSGAFRRLITRKVKQLKESSNAPAPVPTPANKGNPRLPQTEATMYIPLCTTADLDEEDMRSGTVEPDEAMETDEGHAYGDVLSAWVPKNALWGNHKKELAVKFLNNIPAQWTYGGSGMNVGNIMSWAKEWNPRGDGTIPKFTWVGGPSAPSDIRIEFNSNGRRETMIGKKATKAKYDQPTMWLDLNVSGDDYKKHVVIHEFGHALGLGHEHQRSDFWKNIKPYVDIAQMKKDLGLAKYPEAFRKNWDSDSQFKTGKCTAYDPHSIMHYWFKKEWLKNGYSDQSKVEKDRDSGVLPMNVAEALLGVHLRSSIPLADKPSDMDLQLLKDLYGNTSCTILGPPPQPETLQIPVKVNRVESDDGDGGTPPRFSPGMTPNQLEQWLLHEYGSSYKDDISKVKGDLINGELFLELPGDKEWLEELKLSGAFKRLISNKVKHLKESPTVPSAHPPPSSTESTGPQSPSSNGQASGAYTTAAQAKPAPVSTVLKVTDRLSPNHLQQVLDLVWEARSEYYNIGLGLDLPSGNIDALASGNSYKPNPVFTEMIKECLKRGLLTQEKLAKAVSSQQVGFAYMSDGILAEKFTVPQTPRSAALSHQSLIEQLGIHAPKWKKIGTYLGFHQPELRLIENSPALFMGAPGTWFSAMLEAWLQWEPGDKRGSKERASLESLKTAVDKAGLGRTAVELHY